MDEGLLAEVFSNEGIGTLVYANDYRRIRRARKRDIRSLQQLIRASVESDELLPRTQAMIERQLDDYFIFEVDKNPVACVALHAYPEDKKGELACLCVRPSHENQGLGRLMVQYVEERARETGLHTLIALSTQAFNFFRSKAGFAEGGPEDLPASRAQALRGERAALAGAGEGAAPRGLGRPAGLTEPTRRRDWRWRR